MKDPDALTLQLLQTIETIAEPAVRIAWLRTTWLGGSPAEVASVLEVAANGADAGIRIYRDGLLALSIALAPDEFETTRHAAAEFAIVNRLSLARGLLVPESRESTESPATPGGKTIAALVPGRSVTLGERKSLARGRSLPTLEKLLLDPDPGVIRILLGNPALRESDVLRITSKRGVPVTVLLEIFVHPRWFVRYAVRMSLVQNPTLPTTIGLAIVRSLMRQDAESIAANTTLASAIRSVARADSGRPSIH